MTEYQPIRSDYFGKDQILLYAGPFILQDESGSIEVEGEIRMVLRDMFELTFEGEITEASHSTLLTIANCKIKTLNGLSGIAFAQKRTMGTVSRIEGTLNFIATSEEENTIDRYVIHVANFGNIQDGFMVRYDKTLSRSQISFEIEDWVIELQNGYNQETQKIIKNSEDNWGYALTHILEIRKVDNGLFNRQDVEAILESINASLSLSAGRKIGGLIHTGFLGDNQIFEEYRRVHLDRYKDTLTWFPSQKSGTVLMKLLPLLHKEFKVPHLKQALTLSIHLYTEANQTTFIGQPIVYTQVALETVWWVVLSQLNGSSMTEKELDNENAYEKMVRLAGILKIDTTLPSLEDDRLLKKVDNFPKLFTEYRNKIVHPKPRSIYNTLTIDDSWRISNEGLLYLELGLLYIIGYTGFYSDRRRWGKDYWKGMYDPVPWLDKTLEEDI